MRSSLLDTSILIAFLRGEEDVVSKVEAYLEEFDMLSLSIKTGSIELANEIRNLVKICVNRWL